MFDPLALWATRHHNYQVLDRGDGPELRLLDEVVDLADGSQRRAQAPDIALRAADEQAERPIIALGRLLQQISENVSLRHGPDDPRAP